MLRLRVSGAVPVLPLYASMACIRTTLPFYVYLYPYNIYLRFSSMFQMDAAVTVAKSQKDLLVILRSQK
jgi:hypothetical protein